MSMQNQELQLNERLDFYGLIDHDEISVKVSDNLVSRQTIAVQLRFSEDDSEIHQVIPVRGPGLVMFALDQYA